MFAIENFISYEVVQKIGWVLLHFVWQAAAVTFILAFVLRILRRFSANTRYIAACLALLIVVIMPFITMRFIKVETPPAAPVLSEIASDVLVPAITTNEVTFQTPAAEKPAKVVYIQPEPVITEQHINFKERAVTFIEPKLSAIVTIWLLGVFALAVWHLGGYAQLQKLRKKMVKQVDSSLNDKLKFLAQKLGVTQTVQLLESALVQIPTVIGWLKPVILLPASALTGLTTEQLEAILAHELAHIKRYDYLINIIQTVVEILGFYHPAVWWISHKIRCERENCCDDIAVAICGDKIHYAKALASMEEIRSRDQFAIAATGGNLFSRICRLLGKDSSEKNALSWIPALTVILLLIALAIPTTIAFTSSNNTTPSAEFILGKMLEHRSKVKNIQYVSENNLWQDPKMYENEIQAMIEKGEPQQQIARLREVMNAVPENRYQILQCTIDNAEHAKIELTSGTFDSSGEKVSNNDLHIWSWNGQSSAEFSQSNNYPGSATIEKTPNMAIRLGHPWRTYTGELCNDLEKAIEAETPVKVEELEDGTYRVSFDHQYSENDTRKIKAIIDPSQGYICTLEDRFNQNGELSSQSKATYKEVAEGFWFPISGETVHWDNNGLPVDKSTVTTSNIVVNDPDFNISYFDVDIPVGATVSDRIQDTRYVQGVGREHDLNVLPDSDISDNFDPNSWEEIFNSLYSLKDGEVLKRIPTFIPERREYLKSTRGERVIQNDQDLHMAFVFLWDGNLKGKGAVAGEPSMPVSILLQFGLNLRSYDFDDPENILRTSFAGDWIVRKDASQEEVLAALEKIFKEEMGREIKFTKQNNRNDLITAKGKYKFQALPGVKDDKYVLISTKSTDTYPDGVGGGTGTISEFLTWVGDRVKMNIIDNTESKDTVMSWRNHDSSNLENLDHSSNRYNTQLDMLLKNLNAQTGLTFERTRADVEKWFVSENGKMPEPTTQPAAHSLTSNRIEIEQSNIENTNSGTKVLIEAQFIQADDIFLKQVGLDSDSLKNSNEWSQNRVDNSSSPFMFTLDSINKEALLKSIDESRNTSSITNIFMMLMSDINKGVNQNNTENSLLANNQTLLILGGKQISLQDMENSTPILKNTPVISKFLKTISKTITENNEIILIKATIVPNEQDDDLKVLSDNIFTSVPIRVKFNLNLLEPGQYVEINNNNKREIKIVQVRESHIGKTKDAFPAYAGNIDFEIKSNFDFNLMTKRYTRGMLLEHDNWDASITDQNEVIGNGNYFIKTLSISAWKANIYGYVPGQNLNDSQVNLVEVQIQPAKSENKFETQSKNENPELKDNFELLDIDFKPVHSGINEVYIKLKNKTDEEQIFGTEFIASSPDENGEHAIGNVMQNNFIVIEPQKTETVRAVYKFVRPFNEHSSLRLALYNPPKIDEKYGQYFFFFRKFDSNDLESSTAETIETSPANQTQVLEINRTFRKFQNLLQNQEYDKAWELLTEDYKIVEFHSSKEMGLEIFNKAMKQLEDGAFSTWDKQEFLQLLPGNVSYNNDTLYLAADYEDQHWTINFKMEDGQYKINWIDGYTPGFLKREAENRTEATSAAGLNEDSIRLKLTEDEKIFHNGLEYNISGIRPLVEKLLEDKELEVIIESGANIPPNFIIRVYDEVKIAGAEKISIDTQQQKGNWGEAVEGVQVRLQADKTTWKAGEVPKLKADVRNNGTRELLIYQTQQLCNLTIDGQIFRHQEISAKSSTFLPGKQYDEIEFSLNGRWHKIGDNGSLQLSSGKHIIQVTFKLNDSRNGAIEPAASPVIVQSNPVEIEIMPEEENRTDDKMVKRVKSTQNMKVLALAVHMYADDNNDKLPQTLDVLKPYFNDEQVFQWILENVKYIGEGNLSRPNAANIPMAYDNTLQDSNSTNFLFLDGHVEFRPIEEYQDSLVSKKQILFEIKLLEVNEKYLKEEATLKELLKGIPIPMAGIPMVQGPNKLLFSTAILDDSQIDSLFIQNSENSKVQAAPKLLVFDNETATIKTIIEIPYVTDYTEPNNLNEIYVPTIEYKEVGFTGTLTPHITPDEKSIILEYVLKNSIIAGYEERTYDENHKDKVPLITLREMESTALISHDRTLVTNLGEAKSEEENKSDSTNEKRILLALIKATIVSPEQMKSKENTDNRDEEDMIGPSPNEFIINTSGNTPTVKEKKESEEIADTNMVQRVYDISDLVSRPLMNGMMGGEYGGGSPIGGYVGGMMGNGVTGMMGGMIGVGGMINGNSYGGGSPIGGYGGGMLGGYGGGYGGYGSGYGTNGYGGYGAGSYGSGMMGSYGRLPNPATNPAQGLKNMIMQLIEPKSWYEIDKNGKGTIELYPAANPTRMAVTNTIDVHQKIEKFLHSIREAYQNQVSLEIRFIYGTEQAINKIISGTSIEKSDNAILDDKQVNSLIKSTQANENVKSIIAPRATVLDGEIAQFSSSEPFKISFGITPIITSNNSVLIHLNQNIIIINEQPAETFKLNREIPEGKTLAYICQTNTSAENMSLIVLVKPTIILPGQMQTQSDSPNESAINTSENTQPVQEKDESEEIPDTNMVQRVYDIVDIVSYFVSKSNVKVSNYTFGSMGASGGISAQTITDATKDFIQNIMKSVSPDSWYEINKQAEGTIYPYPASSPKKLAVTNTPEIHTQLEKYLESIRESNINILISIETRYIYANEQSINEILQSIGIGIIDGVILDDSQVTKIIKDTQGIQDLKSLAAPRVTVLNGETALFTNMEQKPVPSDQVNSLCRITPQVSQDKNNVIIDFNSRMTLEQNNANQLSNISEISLTNIIIPNGKTYALSRNADNGNASSSDKKSLIILIKPTIILPEEEKEIHDEDGFTSMKTVPANTERVDLNRISFEAQIFHSSDAFIK